MLEKDEIKDKITSIEKELSICKSIKNKDNNYIKMLENEIVNYKSLLSKN